jgi:16S rRNA (cytosine1402-N4)-methyltransferase
VFDIGVSSMQLDQAERGFSFMRDGPLDMRMSANGDHGGETAADIVNTYEHGPLAHLIKLYGEERQSGRIATAILRRRQSQLFTRTLDLAEVVEKALGGRRGARPIPPPGRSRLCASPSTTSWASWRPVSPPPRPACRRAAVSRS